MSLMNENALNNKKCYKLAENASNLQKNIINDRFMQLIDRWRPSTTRKRNKHAHARECLGVLQFKLKIPFSGSSSFSTKFVISCFLKDVDTIFKVFKGLKDESPGLFGTPAVFCFVKRTISNMLRFRKYVPQMILFFLEFFGVIW